MAYFSETFLHEVLERNDIVALIAPHVELKKSGSNLMGLCPFHHEGTPSFSVSPDKQLYHCFGCGKGGGVFQFLMDHDGMAFPEAVELLAAKAGLEIPRDTPVTEEQKRETGTRKIFSQTIDLFYRELSATGAKRARQYLQSRDLPEKIWQDYLLGYAPEGYGFLQQNFDKTALPDLEKAGLLFQGERGYGDRFRDRIMFPIRDRRGRLAGYGGRLIGSGEPKYLNSPETLFFHKSELLYGFYEHRDYIRKQNRLLVVEGYMDVLMLAAFDLPCAVAPLGTAIGESQIRALLRLHPDPIFCFDGDRAGRRAAWRALEGMLPLISTDHAPRFMFLPEGEDPDSLLLRNGRDGFIEHIEKASPVLETFLAGLKNMAGDGADGRARMAKRADDMLRTMHDNYLRQAWQQEIEQVTGITLKKRRFFAAKQPLTATTGVRHKQGLEDKFMAALMQNAKRFDQISAASDKFSLDDQVLNNIYTRALQIAGEGLELSPGRLALEFPDNRHISRWLNEPEVSEEAFTGLLLNIRLRDARTRLNRATGLADKEQLKKELRKLEERRISLYKLANTEDCT